jgi:hypothetical protein
MFMLGQMEADGGPKFHADSHITAAKALEAELLEENARLKSLLEAGG